MWLVSIPSKRGFEGRMRVAKSLSEQSKSWDAVYRELQRQIIAGQLRPRERLVEDEIIERTGATRHAVRRAFDELERVGLVLRQPNKGVQVRDYSITEVEELYEIFGRKAGMAGAFALGYTCSGLYAALTSQADGGYDTTTGMCTSLSVGYRLEAVPAFIAR